MKSTITAVMRPYSCTISPLYCRIASPGSGALHRVHHPPSPVLEEVGNVSQCITVRQQVPAPRAVAVVIEPGAEDEVRCRTQKDTA